MKKLIVILALLGAVTAIAQSKRDEKFVKCASKDGVMEVKLAQLALGQASSQKVKDLAQTLLSEHMKMNEELKNNAGVLITQVARDLDSKQQKYYDKMAKKTGSDFDKVYARCITKTHKHDVCVYKKEAKKGNDPFKTWAAGKVPVLEQHLQRAKEVCKEVD